MGTAILYTIGFTKKSAEEFFNIIRNAGIKRIIDIRLNNLSQLSGFSKRDDLIYFLRELCNCEYVHEILMAPSNDILEDYRKRKITWTEYENKFKELMEKRNIENVINKDNIDKACLLCSESQPEKCHRRLVAEYLKEKFGFIELKHL